jgi:hypothetical protein
MIVIHNFSRFFKRIGNVFVQYLQNESPYIIAMIITYCNVDGHSHARPDRDMPVSTQPLGCDVTQQESEVRSVTGCYATLD